MLRVVFRDASRRTILPEQRIVVQQVDLRDAALLQRLGGALRQRAQPGMAVDVRGIALPVRQQHVALTLQHHGLAVVVALDEIGLGVERGAHVQRGRRRERGQCLQGRCGLAGNHGVMLGYDVALAVRDGQREGFAHALAGGELVEDGLRGLGVDGHGRVDAGGDRAARERVLRVGNRDAVHSPQRQDAGCHVIDVSHEIPRHHRNGDDGGHRDGDGTPRHRQMPNHMMSGRSL